MKHLVESELSRFSSGGNIKWCSNVHWSISLSLYIENFRRNERAATFYDGPIWYGAKLLSLIKIKSQRSLHLFSKGNVGAVSQTHGKLRKKKRTKWLGPSLQIIFDFVVK